MEIPTAESGGFPGASGTEFKREDVLLSIVGLLLKRWCSVLARATSWRVDCIVFKVVWYHTPKYGFVAKFADFPDDYDVVSDCRDGLKSALLEYAHFHVGHIRKEAGLPYQWQRIKLTFKRVSEEEFGPLFDETWDED